MSVVSGFIYPEDVLSSMSAAEGEKLYELAAGGVCAEFGSWMGFSAICMAQSARRVHCVDHFLGDHQAGFGTTLTQFFQNAQRYGLFHKLVTHIGSFEDVLPVLARYSFDLIFCDGLHTEEATKLQSQYAFELRKPGGVLAFHDYSDEESYFEAGFRVKQVVDAEYGAPNEVIDTLAIVRI